MRFEHTGVGRRACAFALCTLLGCGGVAEDRRSVPTSDGGSSGLGTGGASGGGGGSRAGMTSTGGVGTAGGGSAGLGTGGGGGTGEGGVARGGSGGGGTAGSGGVEAGGEGGFGALGANGGAVSGGAAGSGGNSGTAQAGSGGMTCVPYQPTAGATILHSFDADTEGFGWNTTPLSDPMYTVLANAEVSWDAGLGPDCLPGRLKLTIPFTNWNQLANIEVALATPRNLVGQVLSARILFEPGGSEDPTCPPGCYLYVFTGDSAVWAKGFDINVERADAGTWSNVRFNIDAPSQQTSPYDPSDVRTLGMQFYAGGGGCSELPTELVVYLDDLMFADANN